MPMMDGCRHLLSSVFCLLIASCLSFQLASSLASTHTYIILPKKLLNHIHTMAPKTSTPLHHDNEYKVAYATKTVSTLVAVAFASSYITLNAQLAIGVFATFFFWSLLWFKILFSSKNIYSVHVPTTILHDWLPVSLPSTNEGIKIRKDRVVTSISELSGIRGAMMMTTLRVMTSSMNMLVLVAIQMDLHHRASTLLTFKTREDMAPIFMLIQIIGFFMTGYFELNHMDSTHTSGHYIGVVGILTGSLSIGFVLNWSMYSIAMIILEYGLCVLWFYYCGSIELKSNDIAVVTWRSKVCIGIELLMFWVTNGILVSTVYATGANEGNLWVSPFL